MKTLNINESEAKVLIACKNQIVQCSGVSFGEAKYIECEFSRNQIKGYLSQLIQKGYIINWHNDSNVFHLTIKGCDFLLGILDNPKDVEEINEIKANI